MVVKPNRRTNRLRRREPLRYKKRVDKLIIFARAPRLGQVKTRLAAEVGEQGALEIYHQLLATLFGNLREVKHVEIACTPVNAEEDFRALLPRGWNVRPQAEGELGVRLSAAFEAAFAQGARKVAILGSDCPYVTAGHVREAFASLNKADAVFGPATDGGYWLVGLKAAHPELFREIPWSTPDVLARSLAAAKGLGLKIDLLEILSDVDTKADWQGFLKQIRKSTG